MHAVAGRGLRAQTRLELIDQLPPYLLNATLLNNGHFSITTNYTSETKTIIYREDGSGNRPVNYTSHVHIKVDDIIFQMPFENDPNTDLPPPPNPLKITKLYRDTVFNRPRVNATMLAIMPGTSDTIVSTLTMEPVSRPSGGFIRMSVSVQNRSTRSHRVGVLMLIDTKIGDNDQAPIGTEYGYSGVETQFDAGGTPDMPEFWIAFEGTPLSPGLTARGNLRASDLIEPDRFIFGNWVDDATAGVPGLFRALWKERTASGLGFTDSAVLLVWDEEDLGQGGFRLHASTEIGLVDSLTVSFGSGGGGGGGSVGVAGPGSCLGVVTDVEEPCGEPGYSPYTPPSVQSLYLITNTGDTDIQDLVLRLGALPPGVRSVSLNNPVIPNLLVPDATGVTVLTADLSPRLQNQSYRVPISFVDGSDVVILEDTVCIEVPGILAQIDALDDATLPICPGDTDTSTFSVRLEGIRCLPVSEVNILAQPANASIVVVQPLPTLPAEDREVVQIEVSPTLEGSEIARIEVIVRDWESLVDGDTTWVEIKDTIELTVNAKPSELSPILGGDTLDLGIVCVGDTLSDSLLIENIGGCAADVTRIVFADNAGGTFFVPTRNALPLTVERGDRRDVFVSASTIAAGQYVGMLEMESIARPGTITVPIKIEFTDPTFDIEQDTIDLDTVCPNSTDAIRIRLNNPTACDVPIDSITATTSEIQPSSSAAFVIGPNSNVSVSASVGSTTSGIYTENVTFHSDAAGARDVVVRWVVADRSAQAPLQSDLGEVRVGASQTQVVQVQATGNAPITITQLRVIGTAAAEYTAQPAGGATLPITITPPNTVDVESHGYAGRNRGSHSVTRHQHSNRFMCNSRSGEAHHARSATAVRCCAA